MQYLLDVFCPAEPLKFDDEVYLKGYSKIFVVDVIINGLALLKYRLHNGTFKMADWELVKDLHRGNE